MIFSRRSDRRLTASSQTSLPEDGYAVAFILYADKTRLSSFGSQKGYPIVARLANIDAEIRNGDGYGGGQVVGFLPIVCILARS